MERYFKIEYLTHGYGKPSMIVAREHDSLSAEPIGNVLWFGRDTEIAVLLGKSVLEGDTVVFAFFGDHDFIEMQMKFIANYELSRKNKL